MYMYFYFYVFTCIVSFWVGFLGLRKSVDISVGLLLLLLIISILPLANVAFALMVTETFSIVLFKRKR